MARRKAAPGPLFDDPPPPPAPTPVLPDPPAELAEMTWEERQTWARMQAPYCNHRWEKTETIWPGETEVRLTQTCRAHCGLVMGRCIR